MGVWSGICGIIGVGLIALLISRLFGTIGGRVCSWMGDSVCGTGDGCRIIFDCGGTPSSGSGDDARTGDCDKMGGAGAFTLGVSAESVGFRIRK